MKKLLLITLLAMLASCGARKTWVQKIETEKKFEAEITTTTGEVITETVVTEIDTAVSLPGHEAETAKPAADVLAGTPMVYEDEAVKSETWYDADTGDIKNKTILKPKTVPIKQKETARREIKRYMRQDADIAVIEKAAGKIKGSEREGVDWTKVAAIGFSAMALLCVIWFIIFIRRQDNDGK